MRKFLTTAVVGLMMTGVAGAQQLDAKLTHRIAAAHAVLHELMNTPDKGVPLDIAASAECVIVVPSFKKAAFVFGAEYGQGIATCRTGSGWSGPVFVQLAGGSFGFQVGGQSSDLVLIGRGHQSVENLLKDKVKLGGDIAVAAGPVGRNSQAATTELANAEFLTYSRSRGLFAGVDLNGDEVNQNVKDTAALYGHEVRFQTVLAGGEPAPAATAHFIKTVSELFRKGRARHRR